MQIGAGRCTTGKGATKLVVFKSIRAFQPDFNAVDAQRVAIDGFGRAGNGGKRG
ncbi:hypothetical protein AEYBE204_02635 [Asticcacaulis sp. YBE204]|nr:hypothetical protein AEYBE204_02635 [Asticcacaulis sp. YBE204]